MKKEVFQFVNRLYCQDMSRNIKILNVAEKNDAAKNIAALLSQGTAQRVSMRHCDFYLKMKSLLNFT